LTDRRAWIASEEVNLGTQECELALSVGNRCFGRYASLCESVLVLPGSQIRSRMPRTCQRGFVGRIHHRDQNETVIAAKQFDASRESR
jgi:hypothetical protein